MTYESISKLLLDNNYTFKDLPLTTSSKGENVIIDIDGYDEENMAILKTITLQKNGFARINVYHFDGTTEELYEC